MPHHPYTGSKRPLQRNWQANASTGRNKKWGPCPLLVGKLSTLAIPSALMTALVLWLDSHSFLFSATYWQHLSVNFFKAATFRTAVRQSFWAHHLLALHSDTPYISWLLNELFDDIWAFGLANTDGGFGVMIDQMACQANSQRRVNYCSLGFSNCYETAKWHCLSWMGMKKILSWGWDFFTRYQHIPGKWNWIKINLSVGHLSLLDSKFYIDLPHYKVRHKKRQPMQKIVK